MSAALELLSETPDQNRAIPKNSLETFFETATMEFKIPVSGFVTMKVYDIMGREMATLVSQHLAEGSYHATWDAKDAASGAYWYSLQAKSFVTAGKFNLIK